MDFARLNLSKLSVKPNMSALRKVVSGSISFFAILFIMMNSVYAQTTTTDETEAADETKSAESKILEWTFGMGLSYFALDQEAATGQNIGDTAFSVDFYASYYFAPRVAASAGIGFVQLDYNAKFTQQVVVTDLFGSDVETANSDASGIHVYGELHYILTTASSPAQFKAGVGYGSIPSADRSIDNCSNCTEIDIELDGGAYATASVYRGIKDDKYNIGLSGRQYFGGDIKNTATLWFEYIY